MLDSMLNIVKSRQIFKVKNNGNSQLNMIILKNNAGVNMLSHFSPLYSLNYCLYGIYSSADVAVGFIYCYDIM